MLVCMQAYLRSGSSEETIPDYFLASGWKDKEQKPEEEKERKIEGGATR